ncbi:MAG: type II secretion system protein [Verrucomicrobiota bacterium]|jgi:prepilin-type N-terminal cleavage/methylation domain-containing protein
MRWNKSTARLDRKCSSTGFSMIELLCVMAVIGIMASLLLPAVARAYYWARGVTEEIEASEVMSLLVKETRHYCTANPKYSFASKSELTDKCNLSLQCQTWVQAASTDFAAFNYLSPSNEVVLVFHVGRNQALTYSFSKANLSTPEQY